MSENAWIKSSERMPEKSGQYLTFGYCADGPIANVEYFYTKLEDIEGYDPTSVYTNYTDYEAFDGPGFYDFDGDYAVYKIYPTYWTPIPEYPKKEE